MPDRNAKVYLERAQRWRDMAENARSQDDRDAYRAIAAGYEELAKLYEKIWWLSVSDKPN